MKSILAYCVATGKEMNKELIERIIEMPIIESWDSIVEKSIKINKARI